MDVDEALTYVSRMDYFDHDALTKRVQALAELNRDVVRLRSIGKTKEGRDLWLLAIGREPERARPALWIDGNMHAMELAGSACALAFAESLVRVHRGEELGLSKPVRDALVDNLAYVLPRMSPDGAEKVLHSGAYVRSVPVDDRPDRNTPRWKPEDVDGDGLAGLMRVRDVGGDFVESKVVPGCIVARDVDDEGPFYKIFPEGTIESFDGKNVPAWNPFGDNRTDLNRNFPWSWAPEEDQAGAGAFAASTNEARAVVELASSSPHIMAWVNLHTYGGVYIRPLGHRGDDKIDRGDLEVYRQMEAWVDEHVGYATVSGYEEFLYEPDKPLRGDSSDFAYHQLGAMSVAVELWDLMQQAGLPRKKKFIDNYQMQSKDDVEKIAKFASSSLRPWRKCVHPQLGDVEVGGLDARFGIWNPPRDRIDEVCAKNVAVFLRMMALLPRIHVDVRRDGDRVEVDVENRGYLATCGLPSAKKLALSEPIHVSVAGVRVRDESVRNIGHLDGWGHGRYGGSPSWPYQSSTTPRTKTRVVFHVDGKGPAVVKVGSCRVGFVERNVP